MFTHVFRLIWNKKSNHALLIVEILASFLVLFGLTSLIVYNVSNYREPLGFQYKDRWVVMMDYGGTPDSLIDDIRQRLRQRAQSYPEVEAVGLSSGNTPFANGTSMSGYKSNGISLAVFQFWVDDDLARTLEVPLLAGRWFNKSDALPGVTAIVINQAFKDEVFGDKPALGKVLIEDDDKDQKYKKRVVGIVGNYKQKGEYSQNKPSLFYRADKGSWQNSMVLHVRPGTDANVEARLMRDLGAMAKGWNLELSYMTDQRQNQLNLTLVPVIIFSIVCGFLLINVALGLFGVLNLSIARRRGEIGLRRALGATGASVAWQFVGEMWVLATFALVLGLLLAGQFPLLNVFDLDAGVYLTAMAASVVIIYLLVTLCALYPSQQAARIQPATALHEE